MKKLLMIALAWMTFSGAAMAQDMDAKYAVDLLKPGTEAPLFTLKDQEGKPVSLAEKLKQNKYVILDFWASWCPDCRKEIPNVKALVDQYKGYGIEVIGISFDTDTAAWNSCVHKNDMTWTHVSELKKWKRETEIDRTYHINWIPTMYLIGPDGKVILGTVEQPRLQAAVDSLAKAQMLTKSVAPQYDGNIYEFLSQNVQYPAEAIKMGIGGKMIVKFTLDENGTPQDLQVSRKSKFTQVDDKALKKANRVDVEEARNALRDEALRVVSLMTKWKPAVNNGKAVAVPMTLPINFNMQ